MVTLVPNVFLTTIWLLESVIHLENVLLVSDSKIINAFSVPLIAKPVNQRLNALTALRTTS